MEELLSWVIMVSYASGEATALSAQRGEFDPPWDRRRWKCQAAGFVPAHASVKVDGFPASFRAVVLVVSTSDCLSEGAGSTPVGPANSVRTQR